MQRKGFEGRLALVLRFQGGGVNALTSHLNMNHNCSRYLKSHCMQLSRCLIPYRPPYRNWSTHKDDILSKDTLRCTGNSHVRPLSAGERHRGGRGQSTDLFWVVMGVDPETL